MLRFERKGKGKPVVFIHGFLESSTMWNHFDLVHAPFESILIDLPGHGKSPLAPGLNSIVSVAESVIKLLQTIRLHEFDIVGHSLGGYVAVEIHKKLKLQNKLVLFHSNFWEDDEEKKANRDRVIQVVKENHPLFIKEAIPNLFLERFRKNQAVLKLINEALSISPETVMLFSKIMRDRPNNTDYILTNKNKVYIIQGKSDAIVSCRKMEEFKSELPHIIILDDCGHMGHIEQKSQAKENIWKIISNLF